MTVINALYMRHLPNMANPFARASYQFFTNDNSDALGQTHFFRLQVKLQSDLESRFLASDQQWWNLGSFKTYGQNGPNHPYYNLVLQIEYDTNESKLVWRVLGWIRDSGDSTVRNIDFSEYNTTVDVPQGEFFDLSWGYKFEDDNTGRVWVYVNEVEVFNLTRRTANPITNGGGIQHTEPCGIYTGLSWSGIEVEQWISEIEIWDDLPTTFGGAGTTPHFTSKFDSATELTLNQGVWSNGPYLIGDDANGGGTLDGDWDALAGGPGAPASRYDYHVFNYVDGTNPDDWALSVEADIRQVETPEEEVSTSKARRFSTTDKIVTALTDHATQRSYSVWANRRGTGGGGLGRIFDKINSVGTDVEKIYHSNSAGEYRYERRWSGGMAQWSWPAPATGWKHLLLVYDAGSTANNPSVWVDGIAQTVTEDVAPSGTVSTNSEPYVLGNRGDDDARYFNGDLAEWAVWNSLLDGTDATNLFGGTLPSAIDAANLVSYIRMCSGDSPEPDTKTTSAIVTGTTTVSRGASLPACVVTASPTIRRSAGRNRRRRRHI